MGCSAIYHLMSAKNPSYQANLSRLDYGGISILIFGSCVPILYYAMACNQIYVYRAVYLSIMAVACICCFCVTLMPKFD